MALPVERSKFNVQRPRLPTLNLERGTSNCAEGATLNVEQANGAQASGGAVASMMQLS
jgi:hypothetical protein